MRCCLWRAAISKRTLERHGESLLDDRPTGVTGRSQKAVYQRDRSKVSGRPYPTGAGIPIVAITMAVMVTEPASSG